MNTIFDTSDGQIRLIGKLSDDRLKLFVDAQIVPEVPAEPQETKPPALGELSRAEAGAGEQPSEAPSEVQPPDKAVRGPITRDRLLALLQGQVEFEDVNLGVLDDIAHCLARGEAVSERRIVKGVEPQTGIDGKLVYLVKRFTGQGEVAVDEKGFARFQELNMFENVVKGQLVARVYPPKPGVDGKDALGKAIPAEPGKPYKATLDKSVTLQKSSKPEDHFEVIVSEREGFVLEDGGQVSVQEELVINGNLDYHFGSIDFIGFVRIKGDVLPGFTVRAKKGITVTGSVREAQVICPEGDICIQGFLFGGESGRVVSGRSVECSVVQATTIEALGNIVVKKEVRDSSLRSQASIEMQDAVLVGGASFTVCGVDAKDIGNEMGTHTKIVLCSDVEMTTEYVTLAVNLESHERVLGLIDLNLGPYVKNPDRIALLREPQRGRMEKLVSKRSEVEQSRVKLLAKKTALLDKARISHVRRVNYRRALHNGVEVCAGEDTYKVSGTVQGPGSLNYKAEEHAFEVAALEPLQCAMVESQKTEAETEAKPEK